MNRWTFAPEAFLHLKNIAPCLAATPILVVLSRGSGVTDGLSHSVDPIGIRLRFSDKFETHKNALELGSVPLPPARECFRSCDGAD